jgi:hypothetical protein
MKPHGNYFYERQLKVVVAKHQTLKKTQMKVGFTLQKENKGYQISKFPFLKLKP